MGAPLAPVQARAAERCPVAAQRIQINAKALCKRPSIRCQADVVSIFAQKSTRQQAGIGLHTPLTGQMVVADPRVAQRGILWPCACAQLPGRQPHQPFQCGGNIAAGQRKILVPPLFADLHQIAVLQLSQMPAGGLGGHPGLCRQFARSQRLAVHQRHQHVGPRRITDQRGHARDIRAFFHTSMLTEAFYAVNPLDRGYT